MEKQIKKHINKLAKQSGAHLGVILQSIRVNFPSANAEDFRGYAQEKLNAKYASVKSEIRASVRYQ